MAVATDAGTERGANPSPARRSLALVLVIAAVWVALDQLTKWWALRALDDGIEPIWWKLRLNLVRNPGAAFNLARGLGPLLGLLVLVVAILLLRMSRTAVRWPQVVALGIVLGGALGNFADRAFRSDDGFLGGKVVDFIDFQFWPVFNVADIGVTVGVILLIVDMTRAKT